VGRPFFLKRFTVRPRASESIDEDAADRGENSVDKGKHRHRYPNGDSTHRRRQGVRRFLQSINDPWLATHLGDDPSGSICDKWKKHHNEQETKKRFGLIQRASPPKQQSKQAYREKSKPNPTMARKAQYTMVTGGI
jgi:hypothetical protein